MTDIDSTSAQVGERPSSKWPLVIAVLALVAVACAAVAWGMSQRDEADASRAVIDSQREAVLAATGFVEALMSYDHEDLDSQQAAVERFSTAKFREEYIEAFTSEVRQQIVDERASSTVTVQDVFVTVDTAEEVAAIVVARSEVSSAQGASVDLESFLRIRLVRLGDRWQVDDVTSLGSRDRSAPLPGQLSEEADPDE